MLINGKIKKDSYIHTGFNGEGTFIMTTYAAQVFDPNSFDHATISLSRKEARKLAAELLRYADGAKKEE
jgi:hypothetical protein